MERLHDIAAARAYRRKLRESGQTLAVVPTMGALHEGHLQLVDRAREEADAVCATIFVNPAQFGPNEDLSKYPRTLDNDLALLRARGCDAVFLPTDTQMYGADFQTYVVPGPLANRLCGLDRPTHFRGVCTVVAKLFNILQPDAAVFGEKDFQQVRVIEQMTQDLNFDVRIVRAPLVREDDGLAMSSRNRYLTPEARVQARALSRGLRRAAAEYRENPVVPPARLRGLLEQELRTNGLESSAVDYIEFLDEVRLEPVPRADKDTRIVMAVRVGAARLLDNVSIANPF